MAMPFGNARELEGRGVSLAGYSLKSSGILVGAISLSPFQDIVPPARLDQVQCISVLLGFHILGQRLKAVISDLLEWERPDTKSSIN